MTSILFTFYILVAEAAVIETGPSLHGFLFSKQARATCPVYYLYIAEAEGIEPPSQVSPTARFQDEFLVHSDDLHKKRTGFEPVGPSRATLYTRVAISHSANVLAREIGFEPMWNFRSPVLETGAFNHSAIHVFNQYVKELHKRTLFHVL